MSHGDPRPITPIRNSELGVLAGEVGHDTGIVERFVIDFLDLLEDRLRTIDAGLAGDPDAALTTLRSLETTGAMLGADDLVAAVAGLRAALRDRPADVAAERDAFRAAVESLRQRLDALTGASPYTPARVAGEAQSGSASR